MSPDNRSNNLLLMIFIDLNELCLCLCTQTFRPFWLNVCVLGNYSRLVILRPMRNWLWLYPEAWSLTPRGPAGTLSSVPAVTAHRPTPPAALRTPFHPKVITLIMITWFVKPWNVKLETRLNKLCKFKIVKIKCQTADLLKKKLFHRSVFLENTPPNSFVFIYPPLIMSEHCLTSLFFFSSVRLWLFLHGRRSGAGITAGGIRQVLHHPQK